MHNELVNGRKYPSADYKLEEEEWPEKIKDYDEGDKELGKFR